MFHVTLRTRVASVASRFKRACQVYTDRSAFLKPTNQNYWHHNTRHTVAYRQRAIKSHFPQGRSSIPSQNTGGASFPNACSTDIKDRISGSATRAILLRNMQCALLLFNAPLPRTSTAHSARRRFSLSLDGSSLKWQVTWLKRFKSFTALLSPWALSEARKAPFHVTHRSKTSFWQIRQQVVPSGGQGSPQSHVTQFLFILLYMGIERHLLLF